MKLTYVEPAGYFTPEMVEILKRHEKKSEANLKESETNELTAREEKYDINLRVVNEHIKRKE